MELIFQIGLVFLLVLLNGYFVASEFSLVSVRKTRIAELAKKGSKRARVLSDALDDLDNYISATQLGITLASLALGWVGEPVLAHLIEGYLQFLPITISEITSHTIAVVIGFTIITVLHIVLGELAPKTIALQRAEATALFTITPLRIFSTIFKPFIYVLSGAGHFVVRMLGLPVISDKHLLHSEEEIKTLLRQSGQGGTIPTREVEMVNNIFQLGDIPVKLVMVPRTDVLAFSSSTILREVIKKIENNPHSRFPIYEQSIDTITGFIHVKDLYRELIKSGDLIPLSKLSIIREPISVPEMKTIDKVLQDMRREHTHLAVVRDEFGGTAGILTLEDILEIIVGEIEDEFDKPAQYITRQKDGTYLVDGHTLITDIQQKFQLSVKGQGYTTIAGLVFGLLGHEPEKGEGVQINNLTLTVHELQGKRIKTLVLKKEKMPKK